MRLTMKLAHSQLWTGVNHEAGNTAFGPPPLLEPWPGQNVTAPHALYSKEFHLLAHVLATACTGDPASVCKAIEDFGEEVW